MKRLLCLFFLSIGVGIITSGMGMAPSPSKMDVPLVMVMPARMRLVQAGFDARRLRPAITLFSLRAVGHDSLPAVYRWADGRWHRIEATDFGFYLQTLPTNARVTLIGEVAAIPDAWTRAISDYSPEFVRIPSMAPADIFNSLDRFCRYTPREWEWLAARYQFALTDVNEKKREFNPYSIRRSELPLVVDDFPVGDDDLQPAELELPGK